MSCTDTVAAARRQTSPTKNRIAVRRTIGFGAERQSGELSACCTGVYVRPIFTEGSLLQRGFMNSIER